MDVTDYKEIIKYLKERKIPTSIKKIVTAMLDKKANRIVVLKTKDISDVTDFMVICSGNSSRQNKAVADEVQHQLKQDFDLKAFSVEGEGRADWILIDYIDVIIHIFSPETRDKYALEKLWMDAKRYNFYLG